MNTQVEIDAEVLSNMQHAYYALLEARAVWYREGGYPLAQYDRIEQTILDVQSIITHLVVDE